MTETPNTSKTRRAPQAKTVTELPTMQDVDDLLFGELDLFMVRSSLDVRLM